MASESSNPSARWGAFAPWVASARAIPLSVISVAGAVAFGLLRFAYGLFYGRFGITPEEIGLGYGQILAQAILIAVALIAFFSVWFGFVAGTFKDLVTDISGFPGRFRRRFTRAREEGWPLLILYLTYWPALLAGLLIPKDISWVAQLCVVLLIYSVYAWFMVEDRIPHEPKSKRFPSWMLSLVPSRRIANTAQRLVVPFVLMGVLPFWALQDARFVKRGESARSGQMFGLVMWDGRPATVQWLGDSLAAPLAVLSRHRLMYLGGAHGTSIFYDVTDSLTLRLPSAQVGVSTTTKRGYTGETMLKPRVSENGH